MPKTTIEETQTVCTGRGQESSVSSSTAAGPVLSTCRQCQGAGYIVTKRVVTTEK